MAKNNKAFEKTLLDSLISFREESVWAVDSNDLVLGDSKSPYWSMQFDSLSGGRQEGVDLLTIDNGLMSFCVVPTRGMGIYEAYCDDIRLGWDSPVDEIVNPAYIDLNADGGLGWLQGFNEFFVRCGMTKTGAPCELGPLHGRIANIPASTVAVRVELEKPYNITVYGVVRETAMYLHNLVLETEITTQPGANWIKVRDRVTNLSSNPDRMQMLYHINYGTPLLGDGAKLITPVESLYPRDPYPAKDVRGWNRYGVPGCKSNEQCMFMELKADRKGNTMQLLKNPQSDIGVVQSYAKKTLPYFTQWKQEGNFQDGYVTGLEPATNFPNSTVFEHKKRRYVNLKGGSSWNTEITMTVLQGRKEVAAAEKKIKAIQGRKKPEIHNSPDKRISVV
ncbi:MAG: aldose 1-epimerase family protein [Planctomycetota bacterium]|jgi:hypothetical protein